jgi:hypothetical protein
LLVSALTTTYKAPPSGALITWLVFKHQDADNLLKNVIRLLGFRNQDTTHKIIRIDERTGYIITYAPKNPGDIPSFAPLGRYESKT